MAALSRCLSLFYKVYPNLFYLWLLQVLRFMILAIIVFWNSCRYAIVNYKYMEVLNKKSCKFVFRRKKLVGFIGQDCAICLSEFENGDKGRKLETCKHIFHENYLEKWLSMHKDRKATCPLCRTVIISEEIVEEYRKVLEDEGKSSSLAIWLEQRILPSQVLPIFGFSF
ncbi:e3 ubiquitin-protein ligase rha2a [Nicotiana attenuata]|uniref:E3 ubiquitin-protein ligase rha2a n=1 Tax=Nicotiana attenuata TaxID=49451 RepID=A0A314L2A2_NICAT|nr:e3 ubiquitin-protein ligase rha2a [Nicotiana attenuata]